MNIFETNYFRINSNLNCLFGVWSYQKRWKQYTARGILLLLDLLTFIPEFIYLAKMRTDLTLIVESLSIFLTHIMHMAKYLNAIVYEEKIFELCDRMNSDWLKMSSDDERKIIRDYLQFGKNLTRFMFYSYCICIALYLAIPLVPRVLDRLQPLNESRPYIYVFFGFDYLVDPEKYFVPIYIHQCIIAIVVLMSALATDTTYDFYTEHACALFSILRNKWESMVFSDEHGSDTRISKSSNLQKIKNCIIEHENAIKFCNTVESIHVKSLFLIMGISVCTLTMTGLQVVTNLDKPTEAIRFSCFCIGHFMHVFFYAWNSQRLIDHSSLIYESAYNSQWQTHLNKSSRQLLLVMLRSKKPCIQTAGKVFPLTLMNFTMIVKTSMSYFTVLRNSQQ